jgi:hypothetical protein
MAHDSAQPQMSTPEPALKRLDRFVGTWTMEGRLAGSSETTIKGQAGYRWEVDDDTVMISVSYGPPDATFTGAFSDDGKTFGGGWRPNPGADETANVAYDISGRHVK